MAAMITSSILNPRIITASGNDPKPAKPQPTAIILPAQALPKNTITLTSYFKKATIAASVLAPLLTGGPTFAEQIADIADAGGSDNRGVALLLPVVPALGWVLFNILQPALNQLNRMRETRGVSVGVSLSAGAAASGFLFTPGSEALEMAQIAEASGDNRGLLLLFVISPALAWVLYNILQPALNQINKMRSG